MVKLNNVRRMVEKDFLSTDFLKNNLPVYIDYLSSSGECSPKDEKIIRIIRTIIERKELSGGSIEDLKELHSILKGA